MNPSDGIPRGAVLECIPQDGVDRVLSKPCSLQHQIEWSCRKSEMSLRPTLQTSPQKPKSSGVPEAA